METIDFPTIIPKFDAILKRGLCAGVGKPDGQMCIEAAITQAMGLPFNDQPECVAPVVRAYKIRLNDAYGWASPQSRAVALRNLGIAQLGSKGLVDEQEFVKRLAEKTIRVLIPKLFRAVLTKFPKCLEAADRCEKEGTRDAAAYAAYAAAYAATAAADASYAAATAATAAADAADAAAYAAYAAAYASATAATAAADAAKSDREEYLRLSAELALEVLTELKSPGCEWLDWTPPTED